MKKLLPLFVSFVLLLTCFSCTVTAADEVNVVLDGKPITFDVPAQIINDRTMVPLRAIFEALGADVEWHDETQTAVGSKMGIFVEITINDNVMHKNFNEISLDTPAQLVDGRTLVPVRAISESFGIGVEWDDNTNTVILSDKNLLQSIDISEELFFQGEVVDGIPFGYGTLYEFSEEIESMRLGLWEGLFLKSGYALETYANGEEFLGYITDDIPNGYGEYRWNSGQYYEGNIVNGERDGYGRTTWPNGDYYVGEYKNDKANGYGEYYYASGDYYKGDNLDNKAHGYGEYHYASGSYYTGEYVNGVRHGIGFFYDAEHDVSYSGTFVNGKYVPSATGTTQTSTGYLAPASFRNAKLPLYLYSNDGKTFLGKLTTNKYDADSIFNDYGTYGSKYSSTSIWNEYGTYGSKYNSQSAFNPYTSTPPIIVDSNYKLIGYLTTNKYVSQGITIPELMQILTDLNQ